jgi:hypothetical protein
VDTSASPPVLPAATVTIAEEPQGDVLYLKILPGTAARTRALDSRVTVYYNALGWVTEIQVRRARFTGTQVACGQRADPPGG